MGKLRVIFMGTAEVAKVILESLTTGGTLEVIAVVTQPDKQGDRLKVTPPAVKVFAEALHLPVLQPLKARDEVFIGQLRELNPDLIVVVAYGQILPAALLELPKFGCLNVHMSLLPKYRGAAPIQWAIANGEPETGVTIMKMDVGLDTGPVLSFQSVPILPEDDSQILHQRLAALGAQLLLKTIPEYVAGNIVPLPQSDTGSTYAAKIKKEDGRVDWNLPADKIWNRMRAFTPWPGVFTYLPAAAIPAGKPQLLKVFKLEVMEASGRAGEIMVADKNGIVVACGEKALRILELQREGGKRLSAGQFLTGCPLKPGMRFETQSQ